LREVSWFSVFLSSACTRNLLQALVAVGILLPTGLFSISFEHAWLESSPLPPLSESCYTVNSMARLMGHKTLHKVMRSSGFFFLAMAFVSTTFFIQGWGADDTSSPPSQETFVELSALLRGIEAATFQCIASPLLNRNLESYQEVPYSYDVSEWNYVFTGFMDNAGGKHAIIADALFAEVTSTGKRPLQMGEIFTKADLEALRQRIFPKAMEADGRLVWDLFPGRMEHLRPVCVRLVRKLSSSKNLGVIVILPNVMPLEAFMQSSAKGNIMTIVAEDGRVMVATEPSLVGSKVHASGISGLTASPGNISVDADSLLGKYKITSYQIPSVSWSLAEFSPRSAFRQILPLLRWIVMILIIFVIIMVARDSISSPFAFIPISAVLDEESNRPGPNTPPAPPDELPRTPPSWLVELSERERQIVRLLPLGLSNKEIAAELGIKEQTVKNYLGALYIRIGVRDRVSAVILLTSQSELLK